jgi:hypothetical protein
MELIWLALGFLAFAAMLCPTLSRRFGETIKKSAPQKVSANYWGQYEDSEDSELHGEIKLPDPCRRDNAPVGSTSYSKGKSFNS